MKKIRIAINGFGRIGRHVFKIAMDHPQMEVVAINDLGDTQMLTHLLKYDSLYGTYGKTVERTGDSGFTVDGAMVQTFAERNPVDIPWGDLDIDVVMECTGVFRTTEACQAHLDAGAKKVIISAPAKDDATPTFVLGVNADEYAGQTVISNASCTTNCLAPVVKVLQDSFGIEKGLLTTVHAYTQDQRLHDAPHKDYRRARAANLSIVPTTTGAAKAVTKVIPELKGKLDGMAIRVPTPVVSVVDFVAVLSKDITVDEVNAAMKAAAEGPMQGILTYATEPLVSMDYKGHPSSSIFDSLTTYVSEGTMVKVLAWYDNEFGYSSRMVDLAAYISR